MIRARCSIQRPGMSERKSQAGGPFGAIFFAASSDYSPLVVSVWSASVYLSAEGIPGEVLKDVSYGPLVTEQSLLRRLGLEHADLHEHAGEIVDASLVTNAAVVERADPDDGQPERSAGWR